MLVKPDRVLLLESSTPVSGLIIVVLPKKFIDLMGEVFGGLLTRLVNTRIILKKYCYQQRSYLRQKVDARRPCEPNALASGVVRLSDILLRPEASANGSRGEVIACETVECIEQ